MAIVLWLGGGVFFLFLLAFTYWRLRLVRSGAQKVPILLFHKVEPQAEWGVTALKPAKFRELMHTLAEQGYQTLSLEEFSSPDNLDRRRKLLITFDDGYEGVYTHAFPILESFGFNAAVFVITGFVGKENSWDMNLGGKKFRHLDWNQIRELSERGFSIGSHTVNHFDLTKLNSSQVEYELKKSKQDLQDQLGREVVHLSYPFGRFNQLVQKEALGQGYHYGFSIYPGRIPSLSENLSLKRIAMYSLDSPLSLRIKLQGGFWYWLEDLKGFLINRLSLTTTLVKPLPDYLKI